MPVPSRIRLVKPATRASATSESRNGVSGGVGTGLSRTGIATCSPVQIDSNPDSSAASATLRCTSGSAHDPKLIPKSPKRMAAKPAAGPEALPAPLFQRLEQPRQLGGQLALCEHAPTPERL